MGYVFQSFVPQDLFLFGTDFALNHDNIEHKAEFNVGEKQNMLDLAAFYRIGFSFFGRGPLKIRGSNKLHQTVGLDDNSIAGGITYRLNSVFTTRFMYEHERLVRTIVTLFQALLLWRRDHMKRILLIIFLLAIAPIRTFAAVGCDLMILTGMIKRLFLLQQE